MAALLVMLSNPFPSSLYPSSFSSTQARFPIVATLYTTPEPHEWSSVMKLSTTTGKIPQFKPLLGRIGVIAPRCLVIRCSSNSSSNLGTEMGLFLSLLKEIGLSERETEVLVKKNPAIRFAPYRSLSNRIISLQSLGINGIALCRLITRRPTVLTAEEIDPLLRFIRDDLKGKMEAAQLRHLLTVTEPRLLLGFDKKVSLLLHNGIPQEKLSHVLSNVNLTKAICLKSTREIERTLAFLDCFGIAGIIVQRPAILNYNLDSQLIPRIGILTELGGGDRNAAGAVLRKLPAVLTYSVEHVEGHVEFLRSFAGLTSEEIYRIVLVFPNVISASKMKKLHPRIDFLKQSGLNSNDIFKFLIKSPLFLGLSFKDNLACKLSFLVKIGYEYKSKELAMAMGAVTRTSCDNLQKVIELFLCYGLTFEDIVSMSKKHPQILQYCHRSLEEKMEYLIVGMGREVGELLAFPAFLGYKLNGRIKQRYEEKKKTIGEDMSINKLLSVSTANFKMRNEESTIVRINEGDIR